jgi:GrpB-like predicted nucleotidyltransferase (UPF0157 family)
MILSKNDPAWRGQFAMLERVLLEALGPLVLRVEHVGSTAIPGISAKPILDIDVVIESDAVFPQVTAKLAELGYVHEGDRGIAEREAFKRQDEFVPWLPVKRSWMAQHLYVCPAGSRELDRHVCFRDVLKSRPDLCTEYEAIKIGIERRSGGDRESYARLKEAECRDFVERVMSSQTKNP